MMTKTQVRIAATLALPVAWSNTQPPPSNTGNQVLSEINTHTPGGRRKVSMDTKQLVETLDSDNDGVLSLAELNQKDNTAQLNHFENTDSQVSMNTKQLVDKLDSDNDGALSLAELNQIVKDEVQLQHFEIKDSQETVQLNQHENMDSQICPFPKTDYLDGPENISSDDEQKFYKDLYQCTTKDTDGCDKPMGIYFVYNMVPITKPCCEVIAKNGGSKIWLRKLMEPLDPTSSGFDEIDQLFWTAWVAINNKGPYIFINDKEDENKPVILKVNCTET